MKLFFLIKYKVLHVIFDFYKGRAIGKKNWYALNIHAKIEKYLTFNADNYCDIVNS